MYRTITQLARFTVLMLASASDGGPALNRQWVRIALTCSALLPPGLACLTEHHFLFYFSIQWFRHPCLVFYYLVKALWTFVGWRTHSFSIMLQMLTRKAQHPFSTSIMAHSWCNVYGRALNQYIFFLFFVVRRPSWEVNPSCHVTCHSSGS